MKTPARYAQTAILGLALSIGLVLLTQPVPALAQPLKGGARMLQPSLAAPAQNAQATAPAGMSCPMCSDAGTTAADASAKGFYKSKDAAMHNCPACGTRIEAKGLGKAAKDAVVHTCNTCPGEMASCCGSKPL